VYLAAFTDSEGLSIILYVYKKIVTN